MAKSATTPYGSNVEGYTDGNILHLAIDMTQDAGKSKSGKNTIVASTKGNRNVAGTDLTLGLNLYRS
jgi:hypothetical protein